MVRSYAPGEEPVPGYRLIEFLGRGGFGDVWKALGPGGTTVGLKIINVAENKLALREYRALSQVKNIRHPNLVTIHGIWLKDRSGRVSTFGDDEPDSIWLKAHGDELLIAMDLGEQSLSERLQKCKEAGLPGIPVQELLDYMADAARGIDYLNQTTSTGSGSSGHKPIQHCDIKPHNLLIVGGCIKVCDFGLARPADVSSRASSAGAATIVYSPPEYLVRAIASQSTDQYSLAITYYELRTGHLPFEEGVGPYSLISSIADGKLNFSRISSKEEEAVLRRATSVAPSARYPSVREMVNALKQAVEGTVSSRSGPKRVPKNPREMVRPGEEVVPGYKLKDFLGEGAYGEVWEASGPGGVPVALKIIFDPHGLGAQELRALERIKSIRQRHLLELHGFWLLDERGEVIADDVRGQADAPVARMLVIATQLADKNLRQRLDECRNANGKDSGIEPKELLRYMRQAAEAIDYLNSPRHHPLVGSAHEVVSASAASAIQPTPRPTSPGPKSDAGTVRPSVYASLRLDSAGTTPTAQPAEEDAKAATSEWDLPLDLTNKPPPQAKQDDKQGHSIQHRDIKPENILLIGQDVRVADFSLAKVLEGAKTDIHKRSAAFTLAYAAPEFFAGHVTRWSDQYSLAITYYHLRTGKLPFVEEKGEQVMQSHKEGKLDLSRLAGRERDIIRRATALVPEQRYPTCTAMVDELGKVFADGTQDGTTGGGKLLRWAMVLAGVVMFGLGAFYVGSKTWWNPPSPPHTNGIEEPPPVKPWLPPDCVAADDHAEPVSVGTMRLYERINKKKYGISIPFRLIPQDKEDDPRPFYMMENKVSNDQFELAMKDPAFLVPLKNYMSLHPGIVNSPWQDGVMPPKDRPPDWGDLPAFSVTVTEAYFFAKWLGGKLPSAEQWDKAGGRFNGQQGPHRPDWKAGGIAVNGKPMGVGTAEDDISLFLCRDMAGNGREWTGDLDSGKVGIGQPDPRRHVMLRGASFTDEKPYSFETDAILREFYTTSSPVISFRVVLEIQ